MNNREDILLHCAMVMYYVYRKDNLSSMFDILNEISIDTNTDLAENCKIVYQYMPKKEIPFIEEMKILNNIITCGNFRSVEDLYKTVYLQIQRLSAWYGKNLSVLKSMLFVTSAIDKTAFKNFLSQYKL